MIRIITAIFICSFFLTKGLSPLIAQDAAAGKSKGASILNLLSDSGKIIPDTEPNSILVIDYLPNVAMVVEYLKMVDIASEQLIIEARVVEVKLEKEHSLGVNWTL